MLHNENCDVRSSTCAQKWRFAQPALRAFVQLAVSQAHDELIVPSSWWANPWAPSAVWTATIARVCAFCSVFQNLHNKLAESLEFSRHSHQLSNFRQFLILIFIFLQFFALKYSVPRTQAVRPFRVFWKDLSSDAREKKEKRTCTAVWEKRKQRHIRGKTQMVVFFVRVFVYHLFWLAWCVFVRKSRVPPLL